MEENNLAIQLFNKSPLKQQKYKVLSSFLGNITNKTCLDIGSDNGVISYLFRKLGGTWYSCDLTDQTVNSIKELVGERVSKIYPTHTEYPDKLFDMIVIVDLLEHLEDDTTFVKDLNRILKPGGEIIINVPNPKEGLWRKIKFALGQTDVAHGHVRAGYTLEEIKELFGENYKVESYKNYLHLLADFTDAFITFGISLIKKNSRSEKGTVVTGDDFKKLKKSLKLFSLIYPILSLMVKIDQKLNFLHGNMLAVKLVKNI